MKNGKKREISFSDETFVFSLVCVCNVRPVTEGLAVLHQP